MGRSLPARSSYSDANLPPSGSGRSGSSDIGFDPLSRGLYSNTGTPIIIYDSQLSEINNNLKEIKELLVNLVNAISITSAGEDVIQIRKLSFSKAKDEIARYFRENDGKEIGYDELIEALRIDPNDVIRACAELEKEGKIG